MNQSVGALTLRVQHLERALKLRVREPVDPPPANTTTSARYYNAPPPASAAAAAAAAAAPSLASKTEASSETASGAAEDLASPPMRGSQVCAATLTLPAQTPPRDTASDTSIECPQRTRDYSHYAVWNSNAPVALTSTHLGWLLTGAGVRGGEGVHGCARIWRRDANAAAAALHGARGHGAGSQHAGSCGAHARHAAQQPFVYGRGLAVVRAAATSASPPYEPEFTHTAPASRELYWIQYDFHTMMSVVL